MTPSKLETPHSSADLFEAVAADEAASMGTRPLFTGDILTVEEDGSTFCLVQHPCAMRRGTELLPSLLVCSVVDGSGHRSDWQRHTPTEMPLPGLPDLGAAPSISFLTVTAVGSSEAVRSRRVAILSRIGVNLLVQRWLYHNSRVIVPTITIDDALAAQHEEADLTMECVDDLVERGYESDAAEQLVDEWLDAPVQDAVSLRRQLVNPQARSSVRKELRRLSKLAAG